MRKLWSERAYKENDMRKANKLKICVITQPLRIHILVSRLLEILEPLSNEIFVITGNFPEDLILDRKIHIENVKCEGKREMMRKRTFKYILAQLRISLRLIKISKNVDIIIFFLGGGALLLPMLSAKLLRKRVVLIAVGSGSESIKRTHNERFFGMGGFIFSHIIEILEKINYRLSDKIVIYSENLIDQFELNNYKNKILIAHEHFFDLDKFKINKRLDEREYLVGYIGRLSKEKGTLNFVKAIPKILEERKEIKFLIGGDGYLRDEIKEYLDVASLNDKVKLTGWVPDEEFLTYLNELKLFVLPSYTEGLPHTILEAMACGTPVLATPVGAIPDVIKDGETGFIMENNSPECIAENIVRALAHPNVNEITRNARALIEEKYNYLAAVDGYRIILSSAF